MHVFVFQTCYCEDHVKRKGFKYDRNQAIPCPKCNYDTQQTKDLSMSSKYLIVFYKLKMLGLSKILRRMVY